jgi:hypothetical protein
MFRITRSRRIPTLSVDSSTKNNNTIKPVINDKNKKTASNKAKVLEHDKKTSSIKQNKESNVKNTRSKMLISKSKLHPTKICNPLVNKSSLLTKNSPALRDRTNSFNKLYKVNNRPVTTNTKLSSDIKIKKAKLDNKLLVESQILIERCNITKYNIQNKNSISINSEKQKNKATNKQQVNEIDIKKEKSNSENKVNKTAVRLKQNIDKNYNEGIQQPSNKKTNIQDASNVKNKILREKNILKEDLQKLLNEDEELVPVEFNKIKMIEQKPLNCCGTESIDDNEINDKVHQPIINKNVETKIIDKVKEEQITTKKFFKSKDKENNIKPAVTIKKNIRQRVIHHKNKVQNDIHSNESKFSLAPIKQRKSIKLSTKQLRPRMKKNYCEISKLSESKNASAKESEITAKDIIENNKKIEPVYKSINLSQDNVKNKDEIYNFPDDSQDNGKKIKKRKKTVKKTGVKRVKKIVSPRILVSQDNQRKIIKTGPLNARFKEQNKEKTVKNVRAYVIPKNLQDAGDSTIQEISTIKILSDEKLNESKKIDLTVTPSIPKTITSELKLFGPKNVITLKPTTQYSNMVNHSLIRKSMSPITKLVDDFDAGSPWRPIDTFSRVQQIVQSTPQINRLPSMCKKKLSAPKINLNNKSISLDDTIKVLPHVDGKPSNKIEDAKASTMKNEISPRKFGTVLSNLNPLQFKADQNMNNNSPIKNNQHSPVKNISLQTSFTDNNQQSLIQREFLQTNFPELPINKEVITDLTIQEVISDIKNKENTIVSPKKIFKKKFSTPSPFRFDRIHSSKNTGK